MKHAASVRPEPGSNSPLSESYDSLLFRVVSRSLFNSSFRFCLVFPYHFSRINKFISSSAILFSMCWCRFLIINILQNTKSYFGVLASLAIQSFSLAFFSLLLKFFLSTTFLKFIFLIFRFKFFKVRCALGTSLILRKTKFKSNHFFYFFK